MSYKILEQNGIDIENIDGGAFNNFAAGNRDGVLKGVLEECFLVAEGNSISIGTGVIILQGIRVKITDPEIISVSSVPSEPVRYQIVAQLVMEEGDLSCSFFVRIPTELIKDNFYNSGKGNGIYQQELGRVTHGTNGNLTDIQRTLDIISGGGGTSTHSVEIGNVSTNMIDAGLPAEVDVDSRVEGEKVVIDFNFSFPESRANTIYTVKNLTVKETNNRQFLSDVFLPEGEIENSDTVCLQGLDISSLSPELQNYVNSIEDSGIIYLNRVSPKAFFAVLGAVARPDLYEVNNSGAFSLYLVGNEYGQYQLFGTVISDQSGSAVSAVFDNAGNPLVYKYVKPDTGIPKSDLESSVQTSLSKADSALQSIPIATQSAVGGVKPTTKTSEMTQEVGVDSNGALWTKEASEGTTVVANPTATGTQDLTSLQVGGTVYNIPQSSGGITQSTVIERPERIPAATADSPDFVEVGGTLYRKKAVEGGVAGVITSSTIKGVFNINYSPSVLDARVSQTINFSSNNEDFSSFFADFTRGETLQYGGTTVYNGSWTNSAYRTVNFGNEEQPVDGLFYDYFTQVATPVTPSVSYEYVAQQDAGAGGGGGTQLYCHRLQFDGDGHLYHVINNSNAPIETLQDLTNNKLYIVGRLNIDTSYYPVLGYFNGVLVYISFTGGWTGVTGASFATKEITSSTSITDNVVQL